MSVALDAALAALADALREEIRAELAQRPAPPERLLDVAEAAAALGIKRSLLYEQMASGRLRSVKIGRLRRIPASAISDSSANDETRRHPRSMTRDRLTRMDVSTTWAYDRRTRQLQRLYPELWPAYWCAYQAVLGEAWGSGRGDVTLDDAWCPALPCGYEETLAALARVGLVSESGALPAEAWEEWYGPAAERMQVRSAMAKHAADKRWQTDADGIRTASGPDADRMHHASQPLQPLQPRQLARARATDERAKALDDERTAAIARAQARLDNPDTPDGVREAARFELQRLGEGPR